MSHVQLHCTIRTNCAATALGCRESMIIRASELAGKPGIWMLAASLSGRGSRDRYRTQSVHATESIVKQKAERGLSAQTRSQGTLGKTRKNVGNLRIVLLPSRTNLWYTRYDVIYPLHITFTRGNAHRQFIIRTNSGGVAISGSFRLPNVLR